MNEWIESRNPRAKVVGSRRLPDPGAESLEAAGRLARSSMLLRSKGFRARHGIYRFQNHQEADEWMMRVETR